MQRHVWSSTWRITHFSSRLSEEKAFRTWRFTSPPSKSLSGPLTGAIIGLLVLCQACHSDKHPLSQHSSGDSQYQAEELTEKCQPWERCVFVCVCLWGCDDVLEEGWFHSVCWFNVCECVSTVVCWSPHVCFSIRAVHLPTVPPQGQRT